MVDLVKIRQKAKEKQESEESAGSVPAVEETKAEEPSSPKPPEPRAGSRKAKTPDKPAETGSKAASNEAAPSGKSDKPAAEKGTKPLVKAPSAKAPPSKPAPAKEETKPAESEKPEQPPAAPVADDAEPDEEKLDRLERFKREAGKRRNWAGSAAAGTGTTVEEEESNDLELLRFRLAGEEYAVDIEKIVEIVPPRGTTRVPNAEQAIVGIMSLRGTIVTVFDLRRKLGHPPIGDGQGVDRRMIVVEREGETAGFLVDKVSRVVKLDPAELENHPVVSAAEQSDYVGGVFQSPDGLVILLDLEKILASQS